MGVSNRSGAIRKAAAAVALIAMVGGGIGIGAFLLTGGGDRQQASTSTSRPAPGPRMPTARDFTVGVVVSGHHCDPAGDCVYTYTIEPKYTGMYPLPPNEIRVNYRVTGGHEPQDGTFTVHDDQARFFKDVTVNGPPGATLTASVVDVVEAPLHGPAVSPAPPPAQP
ncbi:hypothetical protein JRC04_26805 [Mycolicibacterium sp. S2-37]|uniref:hypothetical protein n=1 Tax=Mycolicibacterium sp. S2-37 TaxID=2810297 RepID=UPI001A940708|nr:hypothetical protein [Mycolicibacterium sp. S2-37]MBO0681092.1 hypothetical protein [Mycolicibacterium sp. S2-37]